MSETEHEYMNMLSFRYILTVFPIEPVFPFSPSDPLSP